MSKKNTACYKTKFLFITIFSILICNSLFAQWQPDVRMTNAPDTSISYYNNSRHIASNGNYVHAVWIDHRDGDYEIYYKRSTNSGTVWSQDVRLTNSIGNSLYNSISVSESYVHIFWSDNRSGINQIYYIRSTDHGASWNSEIKISSDSINSNSGPSSAVSGENIYVFWHTNYSGNQEITFKHSTNLGVNWEQEIRLTNAAGLSIFSSTAVSDTFVKVTWWDTRDGNNSIYFKRSTNGGVNWEQDVRLTNDSVNSAGSCVSVSGPNVHVVWYDSRDGNNEIYYKRSTDRGITWETDTRLTNDFNYSFYPSLAVSGSSLHLVWQDFRGANYGIYYKQSTDAGLNWSEDTSLTNSPSSSVYPSIAVSGSFLHILWTDDRDGNLEIYYKNNPTGNPIGIIQINTEVPKGFKLEQNYPNPFNPVTNIKFDITKTGLVTLKIYNILGKEIKSLVNEKLDVGSYNVNWNASDFPSGVYFYRIAIHSDRILTEGFSDVKKMILIK